MIQLYHSAFCFHFECNALFYFLTAPGYVLFPYLIQLFMWSSFHFLIVFLHLLIFPSVSISWSVFLLLFTSLISLFLPLARFLAFIVCCLKSFSLETDSASRERTNWQPRRRTGWREGGQLTGEEDGEIAIDRKWGCGKKTGGVTREIVKIGDRKRE